MLKLLQSCLIGILFASSFAQGDEILLNRHANIIFPTSSCIDRCHVNYMAYGNEYEGEVFLHNNHSPAQELECSHCHNNDSIHQETHGDLVIEKKDCGKCHHKGAENKDCVNCHSEVNNYRKGKIKGLLMKAPDRMSRNVLCTDCHAHVSKTSGFQSVREKCVECHNADYGCLYDSWKETLRREVRYREKFEMKTIQELKYLKLVKAYGMHNFRLSQKLLNTIQNGNKIQFTADTQRKKP